ncbi:Protein of unknown function [Tangfeifania diversioriginum]|uniref:DUF2723 domain-containing protein n=1 Tax=Tangfeifania diversioriginum TaxID=1168035 RepID=A0A1M6FRH1_9BACT|nr:DUF2723 domain-containing protein [Tangfeifania diversioriginum]SHJ00250.1 Protein of unknown function [Tangfeifania diversioriginum]
MLKKYDVKLTGILLFVATQVLYISTLQPTTSFWDCSEFILSASKLEINHPAGAPLYMLAGRLFSLLSMGNPEKTAWAINLMSAFFSALTVFLLFHILVLIIRKFADNRLLVIGSALLGSATFAVTDSFWFSAVESEVYGLSMFMLAISFWAALKWEQGFGRPGNEKWLLFLALITGLGMGVHLLNLLVLPSVVMIWGFKICGYNTKNVLLFFSAGSALLLFVLYVLTPFTLKFLAFSDYLFVNRFRLPLHSGVLAGIAVIFGFLSFLIFYFKKKTSKTGVVITFLVLLFLAGFSVYSVNVIRSSANPPVNFGQPDNIYSLINYLNREQYPKRPLLTGQSYNSPVVSANERFSKNYQEGKYRKTNLAPTYKFDKATETIFPRMYSREDRHVKAYKSWIDIKGKKVRTHSGRWETLVVPTLSDNLRFFVRYQLGYMFGRYFMWNFAGRQNDIQGDGSAMHGNWLSGINFIDSWRLGPQEKFPDWLKNNRAQNKYFIIPLVFGLVGLFFHYKTHRETFWIVMALFILGGLGLTIYINEIPITPRERDYVFVVAFMAFCFWIGISLPAIVSKFDKFKRKNLWIGITFSLLFCAAPVLMLTQNFDDHNRANRYAARDFAANILNSCPENAILFTSGDNDTYPLLYCQEVEKLRTDVRIVIMPFLSADWFIGGLREPKYNDSGLQMMLPQRKYDFGKLDFIPVLNRIHRDTSWEEGLQFLKSDNKKSKVTLNSGETVDFLPSDNFSFLVYDGGNEGEIDVSLKNKKYLYKHELALWDIISSNALQRPICFVSDQEAGKYGLQEHLKCRGFVYQVVPGKFEKTDIFSLGNFDADKLYEKLTEAFQWGNISNPAVNIDWNTRLNFNVFQVRNVFNEVAFALLKKGEKEKAANLMELSLEHFPLSQLPYDIFTVRQVEILYEAGLTEEAEVFIANLENDITQTLDFFQTLDESRRAGEQEEIQRQLYYLNRLAVFAAKNGMAVKSRNMKQKLEMYLQSFS